MRIVIFGSWKFRHAEPLDRSERILVFCAVPDRLQVGASIAADLRGQLARVAIYRDGLQEADGVHIAQNLSGDDVPLAIAEFVGPMVTITHLLTRVEVHKSHFLSVSPLSVTIPDQDLVGALFALCDREHLRLCNYECLYYKGLPDTELEFKFNIRTPYNFYSINRLFYEKLDRGEIEGFMPQLGDEIQHWSYDNNLCEILPNAEGVGGYVSIMYWSKKKRANWDERTVTFKKKLFHEDTLERWERNYHNLYVHGTPEESLASYFDLPLASCPDWRRTRLDIACEANDTGNIFFLNFEDSRVYNDSSPQGRLQQCEIEYHKSRGVPDDDLIYRDFERIGQAMESFLAEIGLPYEKTNYSKLSFLKDYMASKDLTGQGRGDLTMTKSDVHQIRLALIGPSGAGKSTTARLLQTALQARGLSCSVHKLAKPLYDIKQMYYQAAGQAVAYDAQDHPLMEQIARSLRDLSPTSLVDNLTLRLADCMDDVILNDDLRDDAVDCPALRRQGFRLIRIFAPEGVLRDRMIERADLRLIEHSPLDAQVRRMRADYVLSNTADLAKLQTQIDGLLDRLTAGVRERGAVTSTLQPV